MTKLLSYNPKTGQFTWKVDKGKCRAGMIAGSRHSCGYVQMCINKKRYLAHRLAWLFMTGKWPTNQIDHINGQRADNRFCNLREADHSLNGQNRKIAQRNNHSSGLLGVSKYKDGRSKSWVAQIIVGGHKKYLGHYSTAKEAHNIYLNAKRQLHPGGTL